MYYDYGQLAVLGGKAEDIHGLKEIPIIAFPSSYTRRPKLVRIRHQLNDSIV